MNIQPVFELSCQFFFFLYHKGRVKCLRSWWSCSKCIRFMFPSLTHRNTSYNLIIQKTSLIGPLKNFTGLYFYMNSKLSYPPSFNTAISNSENQL